MPQAGLTIELDAISAVALGGTPMTGRYGSVVKNFTPALDIDRCAKCSDHLGVAPS